MQRVTTPELLDTDACAPREVETSLRDLCRINRWFGGVSTTRSLIQQVAARTGKKHLSVLEVAAGHGEVPQLAARELAKRGIEIDVTLLDRMHSHLLPGDHSIVADAMELPFPDDSFDVVSCSLFAHHLEPSELKRFAAEALRVSRSALVINDLIRHRLHLALVYAGFLMMRSHISRVDGVASVRRAYEPEEIRGLLSSEARSQSIEISRHYLFRMGVVVWKAGRQLAGKRKVA